MRTYISRIGADIDARRDLLFHIRNINPEFYFGLYHRYLQDKFSYSDLPLALVNALAGTGITLIIQEDLSIAIDYRAKSGNTILQEFPDYESALEFAVALLHVKK